MNRTIKTLSTKFISGTSTPTEMNNDCDSDHETFDVPYIPKVSEKIASLVDRSKCKIRYTVCQVRTWSG